MMKKLIFFIPLIVFSLFYGLVIIDAMGSVSPFVIAWLALYGIAGVLLSKNIYWGAIFGMLPAIHLIYMSTQETGQIVDLELPLGVIILLFYLICGYFAYKCRVAK